VTGLRRGVAIPCFGTDPAALIRLGVAAEAAGFDGFFLWDHIVFWNTSERDRAELLDEGLAVLAGLWAGEKFSYRGRHFSVDPVRFTPAPVQRPMPQSPPRSC
jgi:alkanesulfonate monooxygenase SsuD/methylene tetrahydromethanopterin reductase-like flavin-dependent oxidoreductase (luciferase family)